MKKSHLIILIITAIMALFSAYSLAAINQVYNIEFEWFSQYRNNFSNEKRDTAFDKWSIAEFPKDMEFGIVDEKTDKKSLDVGDKLEKSLRKVITSQDFEKYIVIYCALGRQESPEYRVKFEDIAQRGNVVEIKVSMNSPSKEEAKKTGQSIDQQTEYLPADIIRIPKEAFPTKGGLYFIFKTQTGKQILEKYYVID